MNTAARSPLVAVAMLTYRRPLDVAAAVPLLLEQAADVADLCDVRIIVVDNDAAGTAREAVASVGSSSVHYVVEPEPGISAARNRALDEASGSDFIVFIDDDERPGPGWLRALIETQCRTSAQAVAGRVVSQFDGPLDPWIEAGGFLARGHRTGLHTGTPIADAATNNLLLDLPAVNLLGLRFDADFGLSGGEDSLFVRTFAARGALVVWCAEAVVTDRVPVARMNRRWVVRRAFSHGNTAGRVAAALHSGPLGTPITRAATAARGATRILSGSARFGLGLMTRSMPAQARGVRTAARGAGMVSSAVGYVYQEYRR